MELSAVSDQLSAHALFGMPFTDPPSHNAMAVQEPERQRLTAYPSLSDTK
jgi:hypothetical protein